jgi:ankyrin repeat protein
MTTTSPLLIIVLALAVVFLVYMKVTTPYLKYSTEEFWETSSVDDAYAIPEEALAPNNKHGGVLMFAASASEDPQILSVLVTRGALINEKEEMFGATALSAAASSNSNAEIIDELIRLGAEVDLQTDIDKKTALLIAAEFNSTPEITERLLHHGADIEYRDTQGKSALDLAKSAKNEAVVAVLEGYIADKQRQQ